MMSKIKTYQFYNKDFNPSICVDIMFHLMLRSQNL